MPISAKHKYQNLTYQQLKYLVNDTGKLSKQEFRDIDTSIYQSPILQTAIVKYPIKKLRTLIENYRNQENRQINYRETGSLLNVHDDIFAENRAKTNKWLKSQLEKITLNNDEYYKTELLKIFDNNLNWRKGLDKSYKEGPNHEENGIETDFPEYIDNIFEKYSTGSTGKESLFWLLENIFKLEGDEAQDDAKSYLLTTINLARLAYDEPSTNIFPGKRYSCMPGLNDRLLDMIWTYMPQEIKIKKQSFIEEYYFIAVESIIPILSKMFIDAHNNLYKDESYKNEFDNSRGTTFDKDKIIIPIKNKVCEMFGINSFHLNHMLSVVDDDLYGIFSCIDLLHTAEPTETEQKKIEELKNIDAEKIIKEKLVKLEEMQKIGYVNQRLYQKHMSYFVWDQNIQDRMVNTIKSNVDKYADGFHVKIIPCQEDLLFYLVSKNKFTVSILKKLFLAAVKVGFENLANKILDDLILEDQKAADKDKCLVDRKWLALHYLVRYQRYDILEKLLDNNINVNIKSNEFRTPLMYAAMFIDTRSINLLLDKGAKIDAKALYGDTALMLLVKFYSELKYSGINFCDVELTINLLLARGANIEDSNDDGDTCLICAVKEGWVDAVKLFLARGANIETRNKSGQTAFDIAEENGNKDILNLFDEIGVDLNPRKMQKCF